MKKVAEDLRTEEALIEFLLINESTNIFGQRDLLCHNRLGVQWERHNNPCIMGRLIVTKIIINISKPASGWTFDGEIFNIKPKK